MSTVAGSKTNAASGSGYIPTLDGWRAIAVGLVLLCHVPGPHSTWKGLAGALGVSIFFGISGYLICARLLEEERRSGKIDLATFYIRRAFRILPPAVAYLALVSVLALAGVFSLSILEVVAAACFFRNYVPGHWYTSHFWSLAVEEHFYLFYPALLIAVGRKNMKWVAIAISLATAIWRVVDTRMGILTGHMPAGVYAAARTDYRLDAIMLGCLAAILLKELKGGPQRIPRWLPLTAAPIAVVILAGNLFGLYPLNALIQAATIVVMLVSTVLTGDSPLGRVLELAPLKWVGRLSYSLYLWQQLFLIGDGEIAPAMKWAQTFPLSLVFVFGVAALSYYQLERPMMKVGHRLGKSPVPGRPEATPAAPAPAGSDASERREGA